MSAALLGCTGFLGANLATQRPWNAVFNRTNIGELGCEYGLIVCAAAPGAKWAANVDPAADYAAIRSLLESLERLRRVRRFILISTADVFGQPVDADETTEPNPDCAYGRHRRALEIVLAEMFPGLQIVRLPGVIGPGLKKNAYFDLQHENRLEFLNPESVFQWYNVRRLWRDIAKRREPIIHLCPRPESLAETVERDFPHLRGRLGGRGAPAKYNLRTIYPMGNV